MNRGQKEIIRDKDMRVLEISLLEFISSRDRHMQHPEIHFKMALIQVNFPQCSNINQILRLKQKSRFVLFFNFYVIFK